LHGLTWTGLDDFAGNNVDSIVLEVPTDLLGPGPVIGVCASISRRRDGDVYSYRFGWLTYDKVAPTGLKPHDDLLAHFPYLGPPNP
jgi:hypothetical protein